MIPTPHGYPYNQTNTYPEQGYICTQFTHRERYLSTMHFRHGGHLCELPHFVQRFVRSGPDGGVDNALLLLICFVRNPDLLCRKSVLPCWKSEWLCGAPPDLIKIRSGATIPLCSLPLCDMESIRPMGPMESTSMWNLRQVTTCEVGRVMWASYESPWLILSSLWAGLTKCEGSRGTHFVTWAPSIDRWVASLWGRRLTGAMVFICLYGWDQRRETTRMRDCADFPKCLTTTRTTPNKQTQSSSCSHLRTPPRNREMDITVCISLQNVATLLIVKYIPSFWSLIVDFCPSLVVGPEMMQNSKSSK